MRYVIGLTGGAASGKSEASTVFKSLGISVADADVIARQLTNRGGKAVSAIASAFGGDYIRDGAMDRVRMREHVFRNPSERKKLEAILHPMITKELQETIEKATSPYVILDAALLVEKASWRSFVNRILFIDVPASVQLERLKKNRNLSEEIAQGILLAQASRQERLQYADDVIENTGTLDDLRKKVTALHEKFLLLSAASPLPSGN